MSGRIHSGESGYIAKRMNPNVLGGKVVIYIATEQGIDADGNKYAVVCDAHSKIGGTTSLPMARVMMKEPKLFCKSCWAVSGAE